MDHNSSSKMNNDAWLELQAFKTRQLNRKEKLNRHKRPYEDKIMSDALKNNNEGLFGFKSSLQILNNKLMPVSQLVFQNKFSTNVIPSSNQETNNSLCYDETSETIFDFDSVECLLLLKLCDVALKLPIDSRSLMRTISKIKGLENLSQYIVENFLQKFAHQELITIEEPSMRQSIEDVGEDESCIFVTSADHTKLVEFDKSLGSLDNLRALLAEANQLKGEICVEETDFSLHRTVPFQSVRHQQSTHSNTTDFYASEDKRNSADASESFSASLNDDYKNILKASKEDVERLLNLHSTREKESKKIGEELLELLSKPTAKERNLLERFRSADGYRVQEFCPKGTKDECRRCNKKAEACAKLHFKKIIARHTEELLGDCSFLNTCFHMDSCKYVHYEVDYDDSNKTDFKRPYPPLQSKNSRSDFLSGSSTKQIDSLLQPSTSNLNNDSNNLSKKDNDKIDDGESHQLKSKKRFKTIICPPQWIQCDLRYFDMSLLGKFSVVMADPPWDIHMELPYGTMSDEEMRKLNIPALQDEGVIFLWVTGRAMELGRECLALWGYERIDEIIWVKTNQLQRIIRTGRTGHWLNHGKEHCLVGIKGNPKDINRGLDCDVIVAEVRATSHKPDEIYGIIERLSPGTRKIELFARQHNIQPNWISVGNQLAGIHLVEPELKDVFKKHNWLAI